ncbi:histidine kinase [Rhizocola hellebori]|uniref:histidine kinase n=1 Tax=Rhizocola hellebori TaxID=1392758 RepID=A0A8J3QGX6_9ACTN|nr:histidine kinase [Rhizocola hellebori]GIH10653.1 histidine kinase [Rhizocola hellebori]
MTRRLRALAVGFELFALTLLGVAGFAVTIAAFAPGFGLGMLFLLPAPLLWGRTIAQVARQRTALLAGVSIAAPYQPAPPPPVRQADGWYRKDRVLYRSPYWPALMGRIEWLLGDNATWRDLGWMMIAPVTGGLLALAPALLIAAGIVLPFFGYPVGLLLIPVGFLNAEYAVRGAAAFNRRLLGGPFLRSNVDNVLPVRHPVKEWVAQALLPPLRLAVLLLTSLLAIPVFVATVLGFIAAYGLGLIFLVPMVLGDLRWLATWRRSLAHWSGPPIPAPYRPLPVLVANSEGLFQVGKSLYRTQRWAVWAQRFSWLTGDPATWREVLWRGLDPIVGGLLAGIPVAMIGYGIWGLVLPRITQTVLGAPRHDWYGAIDGNPWPAIPVGLLLAWIGIKIAPAAVRWHGRWSRVLLSPSAQAVLSQRVEQLTQTRADATAASASELRRIERDLHDGTQARLVALGMNLGAIERLLDTNPTAARELLAKTRESVGTALRELRELVRGIHPPVLAERGLADAVRALALDSPLSTVVSAHLPWRLPEPIEAAAYFGVAEALGNAAKHSGATKATVSMELTTENLRIVVGDNGKGGADPMRGSGLRGLAQRLGIFDGIVTISSPAGGPTELTLEIPCASSSPRTSTS